MIQEDLATIKFYQKLGKEIRKQALHTNAYLQLVKHSIKLQDKTLDIGCGYGRILLPLVKEGYEIDGVELVPDYVRMVHKQLKKLNFKREVKVGSMVDLPFGDNSFDKVICLWSTFTHLTTLKNQVKALNEMHRVLRKNGQALVDVPDGNLVHFKIFMNKECFGRDKKLFKTELKGEYTVRYMHTGKTLKGIIKKSMFKHHQIKRVSIQKLGRQLIMILRK